MKRRFGFSLVEVVVAVGIFVAGVVGAIALLSSTTEAAANTLALNGAVRVGESAAVWARQLSWVEATGLLAADEDEDAEGIFANRDGEIGPWDGIAKDGALYEIRLSRNAELSPVGGDDEAGYLAMRLTVTWPVWQSAGVETPVENRESLVFNVAVRR